MNKILSKCLMSFLFVLTLIVMTTTNVYAIQVDDIELDTEAGKSFIDSIIGIANGFKGQSNTDNSAADALQNSLKEVISELAGAIFFVGNVVFFICAIFLGVKYLAQTSQGKADVKAGMANLLVGAIFFYAAELIFGFANESFTEIMAESSSEGMLARIFGTVVPIAQMLSFGAIIFIGLKYMFAGSREKSKIKQQLIPLAIGIMLVFSTTTIINFALTMASDIF